MQGRLSNTHPAMRFLLALCIRIRRACSPACRTWRNPIAGVFPPFPARFHLLRPVGRDVCSANVAPKPCHVVPLRYLALKWRANILYLAIFTYKALLWNRVENNLDRRRRERSDHKIHVAFCPYGTRAALRQRTLPPMPEQKHTSRTAPPTRFYCRTLEKNTCQEKYFWVFISPCRSGGIGRHARFRV